MISSHHAEQAVVGCNHWEEMLALRMLFAARSEPQTGLLERSIARQHHDVGSHHFPHEQNLERIEPVFTAQVIAAA